jgi:hypothetical protein
MEGKVECKDKYMVARDRRVSVNGHMWGTFRMLGTAKEEY